MPAPGSSAGSGWPFLVAAGRHRDYNVLVAPDFLVRRGEHGVLLDRVQPGSPEGPPRVMTVPTRDGPLSIAYRTHVLTPQDLVDCDYRPGRPLPSARDEHNRPLHLVVGFVSPAPLSANHLDQRLDADLDACQQPVLAAYRRFVEDEETFSVAESTPLPLRCSADPRMPRTAGPPPIRPGAPPSAPAAPRARAAVTVGLLAVAVVALLVLFFAFRASRTPTPCPTTTPSSAVGSASTLGPSATCPPSAAGG